MNDLLKIAASLVGIAIVAFLSSGDEESGPISFGEKQSDDFWSGFFSGQDDARR